jgi:hypothetical protein
MAAALPRWLVVPDNWQVLVCVTYACGVAPGCIMAYLRHCHSMLDPPMLQNIVEHVKRLQLPKLVNMDKPPNGREALSELELRHGHQCKWPCCHEQYYICTNCATQLAH